VVPLCEIGNDAHNNGFFVQNAGTLASFTATTCDLLPYEMSQTVTATASTPTNSAAFWISPHVPLLSLAFDRYRMVDCAFHYEPQAAATVSDRLVFAWTDDPSHPFLSAASASGSATPPSQLEALVTQDSVAFMPWKEWSLRVPVATDARFLYASQVSTGFDEAVNRFYSFGSMTCVGSAAPSITVQYGVLYIALTIDLFDPVPIVSDVSAFLPALHATRRKGRQIGRPRAGLLSLLPTPAVLREGKMQVDPDDESVVVDPSPPRYVPAPSAAPGAPGWFGSTPAPTPTVKKASIK